MSGLSGPWLRVLAEAIDAARAVLRDLDETDIPGGLARVAAYQGGTLPPPLAKSLLQELDDNEWLRGKVAAAWSGAEDSPSGLFLRRPSQWWAEVTAAAADEAEDTQRRKIEQLEARLQQEQGKRKAAQGRAKELKRAAREASQAAKSQTEQAKKASEQKIAAELAAATETSASLAAREEELARLQSEHLALQAAFGTLRSRYAKARRERIGSGGETGERSSLPNDPIKLARMLDMQTAELGRDLSRPPPLPAKKSASLQLAAGLRPDSSDAIRWLLGLNQVVTVLVDGYNAQFHLDPADFTSGAARRHLLEVLRRLRATARTKHHVVVVYDSILPGDRSARTSLSGVEIRFAADDRIADEEIVEMTTMAERTVVISSDREVREGAERNGAVVLWSEALADWVRRA